MVRFTFSKHERLCGEKCIKAVFKKGCKFTCNGAALFVLHTGLPYNRFLCTFKRGFGSAVERNRARRLSKEVYRQNKNRLKIGFDFILVVFSVKDCFSARKIQLFSLFEKSGLLEEN